MPKTSIGTSQAIAKTTTETQFHPPPNTKKKIAWPTRSCIHKSVLKPTYQSGMIVKTIRTVQSRSIPAQLSRLASVAGRPECPIL